MQNQLVAIDEPLALDVQDNFVCARFNDPLLQELNRFVPYVKEKRVEPFEFESTEAFFEIWQQVHQNLLFQISPALRGDSIINALFVLLDSKKIKQDIIEHIDEKENILQGVLSWSECLQLQKIPESCINELYHFLHTMLFPQSRYFPDADILVAPSLSLVEFISCGMNQFDGFLFEECSINNHAVMAAICSGKTVMMSVKPLPIWTNKGFIGNTDEDNDFCQIHFVTEL
jgi:hypothetical protein